MALPWVYEITEVAQEDATGRLYVAIRVWYDENSHQTRRNNPHFIEDILIELPPTQYEVRKVDPDSGWLVTQSGKLVYPGQEVDGEWVGGPVEDPNDPIATEVVQNDYDLAAHVASRLDEIVEGFANKAFFGNFSDPRIKRTKNRGPAKAASVVALQNAPRRRPVK